MLVTRGQTDIDLQLASERVEASGFLGWFTVSGRPYADADFRTAWRTWCSQALVAHAPAPLVAINASVAASRRSAHPPHNGCPVIDRIGSPLIRPPQSSHVDGMSRPYRRDTALTRALASQALSCQHH
jgi:hypothetical protein